MCIRDSAGSSLHSVNAGLLASAGLAIFVLLSLPTVLLGMVSPFAIRLAVTDVSHSGQVAGRLYALSTVGSLLGTFVPVLILIPSIGTRLTFAVLAGLLAVTAVIGLLLERGTKALPALLALPAIVDALAACLLYTSPSPRDRTRSRMPSSA